MVLFEIYQRFKGHFLNELCVSFKIENVENSNYKIINALVVPLIYTPLSKQCVSIAKNQYDHLKYLKLSDSSDSNFNCNVDILIGADYYWDFVTGNRKQGNSGPVAVETILGWFLAELMSLKIIYPLRLIYLLPMY